MTVVNLHGNQTYTITAASCYTIADVLVDGSSVGAVSSYTFTDVTTNHTISASFTAAGPYTINAAAGAGGSITPSGLTSVSCGGGQSYTITPDACYHIADVLVDGVSNATAIANGSYTFSNVMGDHTISVSFAPNNPYTITATAGANGNISPSGLTSVGCGGGQTYTFTPASCYHIADVLVDGVSNAGAIASGSYTFSNVAANHTISVSFAPNGPYTISASAGSGGTITPAGLTSVACGGGQTYAITADPCYHILDVLVDGLSAGAIPSYTFSGVSGNHTISVTFVPNSNYIITANAGTGGTISPAGNVSVGCGGDQTFTITANSCYHIGDVLVDGSSVGAVPSYTFNGVGANHTISASFVPDGPYTVNASAGTGGTISPSGLTSVGCGGGQTYSITANSCYHIADVLVDGSSVGAVPSYTFNGVGANHTISASFVPDGPYTVNASAGTGGTISPSGLTSVGCGGGQTYSITANSCYHIADVLVDGSSVGAVPSYTFNGVGANHTISASFVPDGPYTVNASAGTGGTISPSGLTSVGCGGGQTYSITANSCYHIADVLVDGSSVGVVSSYTFSGVGANHTISASFAFDSYSITASAGAGGSITPTGSTNVGCSNSQTYTITPTSCYHIADVLVDGSSVGAVSSYTFNGVSANHTISASFAANSNFSITASAGTGEQ